MDVQFPNGIGLVASVSERLGEGRNLGHSSRLIGTATVCAWRCACHQRSPCWDAHWRFTIGARKPGTIVRQLVECRRLDGSMTGYAQQRAWPVVCGD